jgi:cation diffusion facilitator CzcD-associated flavoprotein CzcO
MLIQDFMYPIKIIGRHARPIDEIWRNGVAKAYQGVTVEDLPNFAMLYGPSECFLLVSLQVEWGELTAFSIRHEPLPQLPDSRHRSPSTLYFCSH